MARELSQSRASPRPRRGHERLDAAEAARRGVRRAEVDALVEQRVDVVSIEPADRRWSAGVEEAEEAVDAGRRQLRRPARLPRVLGARRGPCLLYTSPSPRDKRQSRMPSSA